MTKRSTNKLRPCPACKDRDISLFDYGYSSFNCGHYVCKMCGFVVKWGFSSGAVKLRLGFDNVWNQEAHDYPIRKRAMKKLTKMQRIVLGLEEPK